MLFRSPLGAYYLGYDLPLVIFTAIIAAVVIVRHYENMVRLFHGTENKIREGHLSVKDKK